MITFDDPECIFENYLFDCKWELTNDIPCTEKVKLVVSMHLGDTNNKLLYAQDANWVRYFNGIEQEVN
jgi:hypothetical protein